MISEATLNTGIVIAACLLLIIYLIKFIFRYKHQYESNPLCTFAVIFCLFIVLLIAFLLPVDIFLASFVKEPDGSFKKWATQEMLASIDEKMFATYYSLYGIVVLLIFIVIPFLHFFNEESESNSRDRFHSSVRSTIGFMLMAIILILLGIFLKDNPEPNTIFDKLVPANNENKLQNAIIMIMTIITTAGFVNVSFYTASGIFSWPIGLVLGTASVSSRFENVSDRSDLLRTRIATLHERARLGRLSPREQEQLSRAEEELLQLDREENVLANVSSSWSHKLRRAIRPIQILIGICFAALSLLLLATLIIVNTDRILHGGGPKQGYILLEPQLFNPLQYVFAKLQDLVLIGPIPLLIITCFLVVATISGIRNLGLWFLLARLHRIKVGRTQPQALLFLCITMMLTALAFNLLLYSVAPQYMTFGSQNYLAAGANGTATSLPCSIGNYQKECVLTRSSTFLMRMMSRIWIFGAVFYWWSWAFVAVSTVSLFAYLHRGKRMAAHDLISDEDDFED